jgi:hypothetical protein
MLAWTQRSRIYEINMWVWLYELSRRHQRHIHLGNIPTQDWDGLGLFGVDARSVAHGRVGTKPCRYRDLDAERGAP